MPKKRRKKKIKKLKRSKKKLRKKRIKLLKRIKKLSKKKVKKTKKTKSSKSKELVFKVPKKWSKNAYVNKSQYEKKYKLSIKDNEGFWKKEGKRINWIRPYTKIKDAKYSKTEVKTKWYYDGTLNASANCIDRHLKDKKNKTAIIWVGDDPKDSKKISYEELLKIHPKALYVTETIGHGSNLVTGDYSVGASGFLVENGVFTYPVSEITIAGNFKDIFKNITFD